MNVTECSAITFLELWKVHILYNIISNIYYIYMYVYMNENE